MAAQTQAQQVIALAHSDKEFQKQIIQFAEKNDMPLPEFNAMQAELDPNSEEFKKKEFLKKYAEYVALICAYEEFLSTVVNKPITTKTARGEEKSSSKGNDFVREIRETYKQLMEIFGGVKTNSKDQSLVAEMANMLKSMQAQIQYLEQAVAVAAKDFESAMEEADELLEELGVEAEEVEEAKEEEIKVAENTNIAAPTAVIAQVQTPSTAPTPKPEAKKDKEEEEKKAEAVIPKKLKITKIPTTEQLNRAEETANKMVEKSLTYSTLQTHITVVKTQYRQLEDQTKTGPYGNNPEVTQHYLTLPGTSKPVKVAQPPSYDEFLRLKAEQQARVKIAQPPSYAELMQLEVNQKVASIARTPSYESNYSARAQQQQMAALQLLQTLQETLAQYGRKPSELVSNYMAMFYGNKNQEKEQEYTYNWH